MRLLIFSRHFASPNITVPLSTILSQLFIDVILNLNADYIDVTKKKNIYIYMHIVTGTQNSKRELYMYGK